MSYFYPASVKTHATIFHELSTFQKKDLVWLTRFIIPIDWKSRPVDIRIILSFLLITVHRETSIHFVILMADVVRSKYPYKVLHKISGRNTKTSCENEINRYYTLYSVNAFAAVNVEKSRLNIMAIYQTSIYFLTSISILRVEQKLPNYLQYSWT